MHVWQAYNALFIIRTLIKYMIETGSEYQLLQHFEAVPNFEELDKAEETAEDQVENAIVAVENDAPEEKAQQPAVIVDGTKFEAFFEALVNLIVVIPVK